MIALDILEHYLLIWDGQAVALPPNKQIQM